MSATDRLRPGATVEARVAAAYRDGQAACRNRDRTGNPYDGDSPDAIERCRAIAWIRGFGDANPMPEPTPEPTERR